VAGKNSESAEKSRVLRFRHRSVDRMDKAVRSIVSVVARRLRSRAAVELENLALRHQLYVLFAASGRVGPGVHDRPLSKCNL
jgi:hypothetical protein